MRDGFQVKVGSKPGQLGAGSKYGELTSPKFSKCGDQQSAGIYLENSRESDDLFVVKNGILMLVKCPPHDLMSRLVH